MCFWSGFCSLEVIFFPKLVRENTSLVWRLALAARRCREGHFRVCRLSNRGVSLSGGVLLCPFLFPADKPGTGTSTGPDIVLLLEGQEPAASILRAGVPGHQQAAGLVLWLDGQVASLVQWSWRGTQGVKANRSLHALPRLWRAGPLARELWHLSLGPARALPRV